MNINIEVEIGNPKSIEEAMIKIWNEAIETAALEMDKLEFQISAIQIRKLKK